MTGDLKVILFCRKQIFSDIPSSLFILFVVVNPRMAIAVTHIPNNVDQG